MGGVQNGGKGELGGNQICRALFGCPGHPVHKVSRGWCSGHVPLLVGSKNPRKDQKLPTYGKGKRAFFDESKKKATKKIWGCANS